MTQIEQLVPKLRFKEFDGELRGGTISDYWGFYYWKSAPKWSLSEDAPTPCVRYWELYSTFNEVVDEIKSFTNIDPNTLKFSKWWEVLVPRVWEDPLDFANCSYLPHSWIAIWEMISVYNTEEDWLYMTYYFNAKLKRAFAKVVEWWSVANLYFKYLEPIEVHIPATAEQNKIMIFLTSVDTKIQQLESLKSSREQYKKWVMQKIFSQEIRFKDENGEDFGKWESVEINDIWNHYNWLTWKTKEDFWDWKRYIQYMQIFNSSRIQLDDCWYVNVWDQEKQNEVKKWDVIFTVSSETPKETWMTSVVLDEFQWVYLNSFCFWLRPESEKVLNPVFSEYLFRSSEVRKKIIRLAQWSTRFNMSKISLMKLRITLPSIWEQVKIWKILSQISLKIINIEEQINNVKKRKKWLLQQMFV